jgi:hypothetical protein
MEIPEAMAVMALASHLLRLLSDLSKRFQIEIFFSIRFK